MVDSTTNGETSSPAHETRAQGAIVSSDDVAFEAANGAACGLVAQLEERAMMLEFERGHPAADDVAPDAAAVGQRRRSCAIPPR